MVESDLGNGFRVTKFAINAEEIRRDDGHRLVGKPLELGDTVPGFESAVAVYSDDRWTVEVSLLDLQLPGGRPF